jgi:hypothetical protein
MSNQILQAIESVRQHIQEQEHVWKTICLHGTPEEIEKQENILDSLKRRLEMLELEARYGH